MASQSCPGKEQLRQFESVQGQVASEAKNMASVAPSNAHGTGNLEPAHEDPVALPKPSTRRTTRSSTERVDACAAASAATALSTAEHLRPPPEDRVQATRYSTSPDSCGSQEDGGSVLPQTSLGVQSGHVGTQATMMQPVKGSDPAAGRPGPSESPGNSQGKKQPHRGEPSRGPRSAKRHLFPDAASPQTPVPSPPSSPRPQPGKSGYAGPTLRSHARSQGRALSSLAATPDRDAQRQAAPDRPGPRRSAAPPRAAGRRRHGSGSPPGRAMGLRSRRAASSASTGHRSPGTPPPGQAQGRPARRSSVTRPGPAVRSLSAHGSVVTPGPALPSRGTQRRSAFPSSSGPARRQHPLASNVSAQRSRADAELSDPESPRLASQPTRAVRMRASSPSPPGRMFPFPGQYGERFPSSPPSTPGRSSSSSTSSPSATPGFLGLSAISTPSPTSFRRAIMPELDDLSEAFPEEQDEIGK